MHSAGKALAVRYHETGKPAEVLRVESIDLPEPAQGQVQLQLEAAAINPSDLGMIGGSYGRLKALPAIAGREGVGRVVRVGSGVDNLVEGDRVRMPDSGAWVCACNAAASGLQRVPADLPAEQAAMAFVNPPTAVCLLDQFTQLEPGDWILQNAGNSAVGVCVAALSKKRGLNCASAVREPAKWQQRLSEAGAKAVLADDDTLAESLLAASGGVKPRLALNSIGGESVVRQLKLLGDGGCSVTFGGMVGDKVRYPTRFLIFNDILLRGFWMDRWFRQNAGAQAETLMQQVYQLIREGAFNVPVAATYPLEAALDAVALASTSGREGKVLLTA
jgi:NADPH:quinone reductase-like Zn-dependent oxidoreductase